MQSPSRLRSARAEGAALGPTSSADGARCAGVTLDRDVRVEGGARRVRGQHAGGGGAAGSSAGAARARAASARAVSLVLPASRAVPQRRVRVRARGAVEARRPSCKTHSARPVATSTGAAWNGGAGGRRSGTPQRGRGVGRDGVRVPGGRRGFVIAGGGGRPRGGRWGGGGGGASEQQRRDGSYDARIDRLRSPD